MREIYKVKLETNNVLENCAVGKDRTSIRVEKGIIYVEKKDVDYIFRNYNVRAVEYMGIFLRRGDT